MNWDTLIFGRYNRTAIASAVADPEWQALRISMIGDPLDRRFRKLRLWVDTASPADLPAAQVQVTNYVNALKRGGMIK